MTQSKVTLPSGEYLLVEVPEGAFKVFINNVGCLRFSTMEGRYEYSQCIEPEQLGFYLDKNDWTLLGADPTRLTESEARNIVEKILYMGSVVGYVDYDRPKLMYAQATASLDSLAASLGISKPYVILKNK